MVLKQKPDVSFSVGAASVKAQIGTVCHKVRVNGCFLIFSQERVSQCAITFTVLSRDLNRWKVIPGVKRMLFQ